MNSMLVLKSKTKNKLQYEMVEIQTNFFIDTCGDEHCVLGWLLGPFGN